MPQHKRTATMEDIVEMILHRSVGVSRSEIISVLEELGIAVEFFIKRGEKISTPLFNISTSVGGVFTDSKDTFDPARHEVRLKVKAGSRLLALAPT